MTTIYEAHPELAWPHPDPTDKLDGQCAGPGMPCVNPECAYTLAWGVQKDDPV